MNSVIPLILVFCVAATRGISKEAVPQKVADAYADCSSRFPLSKEDQTLIEKKELPKSKNAKCFAACAMEKATVMKNGKISTKNADGMVDVMAEIVPTNATSGTLQLVKTLAKRTINDCAEKVGQGGSNRDKCETAYKMCSCVFNAAKTLMAQSKG